MGSFKLGKISFKGMFSKPATKMYPAVPATFFDKTAGHVQNDRMKDCILCGACARRCPTGCITVDKEAETWTIDPFHCVTCCSCVRACPKDCLDMLPSYTPCALEKQVIVKHKPELTPEEKAAKAKADAEKAARVKAAREAAAAKKAQAEGNTAE